MPRWLAREFMANTISMLTTIIRGESGRVLRNQPDIRASVAQEFHIPGFASLAELFAATQVDLVSIATPILSTLMQQLSPLPLENMY